MTVNDEEHLPKKKVNTIFSSLPSVMTALWRFSGSFVFAIILIFLAALFVVAGTWIESCTQSHLCASYYTYSSPLFALLLWGFFVNILVSALRRWPFKTKHIPFLLTHLGLLMLIGGVLIKIYWGIQGTMTVLEGSAASKVFVQPQFALKIESPEEQILVPIEQNNSAAFRYKEAAFHVLSWLPNSKVEWKDWIKDEHLSLLGTPGLLLDTEAIPLARQNPWQAAYTTLTPEEFLSRQAIVSISNAATKNPIENIPLAQLLKGKVVVLGYDLTAAIRDKQLTITQINRDDGREESYTFSLDGSRAFWHPRRSELLIPSRFIYQLEINPTVVFHGSQISLINSSGQILDLPSHEGNSLYAIDKGYRGYLLSKEIHFAPRPPRRSERWNEVLSVMKDNLSSGPVQLLPIRLLSEQTEDFPQTFVNFMEDWLQCGTWLCNHSKALPPIDWSLASAELPRWKIKAGIFQLLQRASLEEESASEQLKRLLGTEGTDEEVLAMIDSQAGYFHSIMKVVPTSSDSLLLSAALREAGITPGLFFEDEGVEEPTSKVLLETELQYSVLPADPVAKWEDNRPAILIEAETNAHKERFWVSFDKFGSQLKVPILDGRFQAQFQTMTQAIPYRIRLREARQINYPGTSQPFSYEADVWVIDKHGSEELATLSMNNVYETWDGYRFYLSNISTGDRKDLQNIQIIVNRDPAKYFLTFPGFGFLFLGVLLLLFRGYYFK